MATSLRRSRTRKRNHSSQRYTNHPLQGETYVKIQYDRHVASEAWVLLPDRTIEHLICYPRGRSARLARRITPTHENLSSPFSNLGLVTDDDGEKTRDEEKSPVDTIVRDTSSSSSNSHLISTDEKKQNTTTISETTPKPKAKTTSTPTPTTAIPHPLLDRVKSALIQIDTESTLAPNNTNNNTTNTKKKKNTIISPGILPRAEYISGDGRSWIGTYDLPTGDFVRRTSTSLDACEENLHHHHNDVPRTYSSSSVGELTVVQCPLDGQGRAMVRFQYVTYEDDGDDGGGGDDGDGENGGGGGAGKGKMAVAGFWERVLRRVVCR